MNAPAVKNPRTPRDLDSRAEAARDVYVPPSHLPDPDPEPGYVFKWVMTHALGKHEASHVSFRLREGWVPVKAEDQPKLQPFATESGNLEIGGLMLCKMTAERFASMQRYFANQASGQIESVDNHFMSQRDRRMPIISEKTTEVTKGRGFGDGS